MNRNLILYSIIFKKKSYTEAQTNVMIYKIRLTVLTQLFFFFFETARKRTSGEKGQKERERSRLVSRKPIAGLDPRTMT